MLERVSARFEKENNFLDWFSGAWDEDHTERVPLHEKILLTVEETADLFGIGTKKVREISEDDSCAFVLWNGNKRLIKRKAFEKYIDEAFSI